MGIFTNAVASNRPKPKNPFGDFAGNLGTGQNLTNAGFEQAGNFVGNLGTGQNVANGLQNLANVGQNIAGNVGGRLENRGEIINNLGNNAQTQIGQNFWNAAGNFNEGRQEQNQNTQEWFNTYEPGKFIEEGGPGGLWGGTGKNPFEQTKEDQWGNMSDEEKWWWGLTDEERWAWQNRGNTGKGGPAGGEITDPYKDKGLGGGDGVLANLEDRIGSGTAGQGYDQITPTWDYGTYDPTKPGYDPNVLGQQGTPGALDVMQWASLGGQAPQFKYNMEQFQDVVGGPTSTREQAVGRQQADIYGTIDPATGEVKKGMLDEYENRGLAALQGKQLSEPNQQYYGAITKQMDINKERATDALWAEIGEKGQLDSGDQDRAFKDFELEDKAARDVLFAELQRGEAADFGKYLQAQSQTIPQYLLSNKGIQNQISGLSADIAKTLGLGQTEAAKGISSHILNTAAVTNAQSDQELKQSMQQQTAAIANIGASKDLTQWEYQFAEEMRNMMNDNLNNWVKTFQGGLFSNMIQNVFQVTQDPGVFGQLGNNPIQ